MRKTVFTVFTSLVVLAGCSEQAARQQPVSATPAPSSTAAAVQLASATNREAALTDYLKDFKSPLKLKDEDDLSGFGLLDSDLAGHDVFFTGETHDVAYNFDVQWKLLRYLNQKAGVNYYLGEMSFSWASLVNLYLETGDEFYIPKHTQDEVAFWKKVRIYNQTLPKEKQIRVLGADVEHDPLTGLVYLSLLMKDKTQDAPAPVQAFLKDLQLYIKINNENAESLRNHAKESLAALKKELDNHAELYNSFLDKEEAFRFRMTADNLLSGQKLHEYFESNHPKFNADREVVMFDNVKRLFEHYPKGKYYGEWGFEHVYQKEHATLAFSEIKPRIAQLINEMEPFKGKVLSIGMMYAGSKSSYSGAVDYVGPTLDDMILVGPMADGEATLFKLNAPASPFSSQLRFVTGASTGVTTDYLQYVMVIKSSPPTTLFAAK